MTLILDKLWDADAFEDHNTFDMQATNFGAPLMQEINNPSLHFRRFKFGEGRGVAGKFYLPASPTSMKLRLCSRVRASDDPVLPTAGGLLWIWVGFRYHPEFSPWYFHKFTTAHPNPTTDVHWQDWSIDLNQSVLNQMQAFGSQWTQMALVRRGDDETDTATDTYWDVMGMNLEVT